MHNMVKILSPEDSAKKSAEELTVRWLQRHGDLGENEEEEEERKRRKKNAKKQQRGARRRCTRHKDPAPSRSPLLSVIYSFKKQVAPSF